MATRSSALPRLEPIGVRDHWRAERVSLPSSRSAPSARGVKQLRGWGFVAALLAFALIMLAVQLARLHQRLHAREA